MAFGGDTGSDDGGSSLRPSVFQRFFAVQIKENLESRNWAPTGYEKLRVSTWTSN